MITKIAPARDLRSAGVFLFFVFLLCFYGFLLRPWGVIIFAVHDLICADFDIIFLIFLQAFNGLIVFSISLNLYSLGELGLETAAGGVANLVSAGLCSFLLPLYLEGLGFSIQVCNIGLWRIDFECAVHRTLVTSGKLDFHLIGTDLLAAFRIRHRIVLAADGLSLTVGYFHRWFAYLSVIGQRLGTEFHRFDPVNGRRLRLSAGRTLVFDAAVLGCGRLCQVDLFIAVVISARNRNRFLQYIMTHRCFDGRLTRFQGFDFAGRRYRSDSCIAAGPGDTGIGQFRIRPFITSVGHADKSSHGFSNVELIAADGDIWCKFYFFAVWVVDIWIQ